MKQNLLYMIAGICLFAVSANAQNQYTWSANNQLRNIFSQVSYPDPDVDYLYERSVKLADSAFYSNFSSDTLDPDTWYQLYSEMYYAAHDTLPMTPATQVWQQAASVNADTIPFLLMDYDYYYLKPQALTTPTWFIFDLNSNVLYDKPNRPGYPFLRSNIFSGSPAKLTGQYVNQAFYVDPAMIFTDMVNQPYYYGNATLKIDLGDGAGWHTIPQGGSTITANYPDSGQFIIRTALFDLNDEMFKVSYSRILIVDPNPNIPADKTLGFPGMTVGVYGTCSAPEEQKAIIYLEGYDMADYFPGTNRTHNRIYQEMVKTPGISNLRNFGYQYYVVDWDNSRIDLRFNALYLINLIEYIKSQSENKQQIVIIGESMGGLIARYALTFMESAEYQSGDFSSFFKDGSVEENRMYLQFHPGIYTVAHTFRDPALLSRLHNTRELITIDSPHQGANIPLGLQKLYQVGMEYIPLGLGKAALGTTFNVGLEGMAAKQMLSYHISTGTTGSASVYGPHAYHTGFFNQLKSIGDYPQYVKLMAMASGALDGSMQKNPYTSNSRNPNDRIFDLDMMLYGRLLYTTIPLAKVDFTCRTNPAGSGSILNFQAGKYANQIKLKFFGINVTSTYVSILNHQHSASNVKAYCTGPGGYKGFRPPITVNSASYNHSDKWITNIFSYNFSANTAGCMLFSGHLGWNGIASLNLAMSVCSDGLNFTFVPLQSALDYGKGMNLPVNHDIEHENIQVLLSRTPFHVVTGMTGGTNVSHLMYRNDPVCDLTMQNYGSPTFNSVYFSGIPLPLPINKKFIQLEIGDEEFYIENLRLPYEADFQAEYDIHVNQRNPHYRYVSGTNSSPLTGVFSKQSPLQLMNAGKANFYFDLVNSPSPTPGMNQSLPYPAPSTYHNQPFMMCGQVFRQQQNKEEDVLEMDALKEEVRIFPNPSVGRVSFELTAFDSPAEIEIYSADGKLIRKVQGIQNGSSVFVSEVPGIYFLRFIHKDQTITQKVIIR